MGNYKKIRIACKGSSVSDLESLTDFQGGLKTLSDDNYQKLKKSIKQYGFSAPIFIWRNGADNILDGHQRLETLRRMKKEGYEVPNDIPVAEIEAKNKKEAKEKLLTYVSQYGLATNESLEAYADDAGIDLKELQDKLDIPQISLETPEDEEIIEDEVPELPKVARAKLGQIYTLGRHRLMCGDSTKKEDVEKLMDGKTANAVFHSPPYNMGKNASLHGNKSLKQSKYLNYDDDNPEYLNLILKTTQIALNIADEVFVNLQILAKNKVQILRWLSDISEYYKDVFFWKKTHAAPAMAENVANSQVEMIFLFGKNNSRRWGTKKFRGNFSNFIETSSASLENKNANVHAATYPVALPLRFIDHGYDYKNIIVDMFIGTGTTLIACEQTNRICYGMEIDPIYCDVIIERYCNLTGTNKEEIYGGIH